MKYAAVILCLASSLQAQSDLIRLTPHHAYPGEGGIASAAYSPSGKHLLLALPRKLVLWDTASGAERPVLDRSCTAVALSDSPMELYCGLDSGQLIHLDQIGSVHEWKAHRGRVVSLTLSPDGRLLLSAARSEVVLWDATAYREMRRITSPDGKPFVFAGFGRGAQTIVAVTQSASIAEWDTQNGRPVRPPMRETVGVALAAVINGSGTMLALSLEVAGLSKGNPLRPAHPSDFFRQQSLRLYDLKSGTVLKQISGIDGQLHSLSFSADTRFLAASRHRVKDAFLSVFDLQRGVEEIALPARSSSPLALFSPDGRWLLSGAGGSVSLNAVSGVQRGTDGGNLAGRKIVITTRERTPLMRFAQPTHVAVADFETHGLDADLGRAVAGMVRNAIADIPNVQLVARDRMRLILNEQNVQLSDRVDPSTAVQLGRILNVSKILFGNVSGIGESFVIQVQIVDVATSRVDGIREVVCQRCLPEDLVAAVAELKQALVDR